MEHQDFSTITLVNKSKIKYEKNIEQRLGDNSRNDELKKIENSDNFSIQKIPIALSKEIANIRLKLKLSQDNVANRLNIQKNIYNEIENGKAQYNSNTKKIINKIENIFKVKFENKKIKK